ncbi:MAG: Unknown protein [uncultured Sulfurovum sp.]|uniref:Uncharacterized protein n=1 Tax=uncultured Sulfurovum sp. TaxID=269237 RepID=A0A6S6TR53_9BACT|nr:MAG: Unknown protein [uncultured Sulfurovum sp.]
MGVGLVVSYIYFMREKKENLQAIQNGICPKCKKESMELIDQRSTGCSGPKMLTFECQSCDYINTFNISSADCSTNRC